MPVPATLLEVAEDDEVAAVERDDLPVAAPQRAVRPPAVLDEPRLADGGHLVTVDRKRPAARAGLDRHGLRDSETPSAGAHGSNGVSTTRRSGTRESGSTSRTRSAASGPATARVWRTASRKR